MLKSIQTHSRSVNDCHAYPSVSKRIQSVAKRSQIYPSVSKHARIEFAASSGELIRKYDSRATNMTILRTPIEYRLSIHHNLSLIVPFVSARQFIIHIGVMTIFPELI